MNFSKLFIAVFVCLSCTVADAQMGPWSNTGPVPFPINVSGQIHGIGRVSQIKFHPTNAQKMYAVSASGGLYISLNNGQTWTPTAGTEQLPTTSCSAVCIDYTNDNILYLSLGDANYYGNDFGTYKSTNGGVTWAASNTGMGTAMSVEILMDPLDHTALVAATNNGIWKSINSGASWTQKQTGAFRDMKAKPGSNTILYASTATAFYRSTDFGNTWTSITNGVTLPTGNGGTRIAVSNANANIVYLAGVSSNGRILKSTDGGTTFTTVYTSTTQCLTCYDQNPASGSQGDYNFDINANPQDANELLLVAHCVWRSTDGGATWSKRTDWPAVLHTDMHHIEFNPYNNTQRFTANDGGVWLSTDPVASAWNPRSDGLAATEIYHSAQSPITRQLISIGTQDNGELYFDNQWKCNRGGDWGAKCKIDYLGTGAVYYLSDGKRRNLQPLGGDQVYNTPFVATNNSCIEFLPKVTSTSYLAKDTIYRSTNINTASPSWTAVKFATEAVRDIVSCRADSNILYYVTSANHIFRTDNALAATPSFTQYTTPGATNNATSIATYKGNANIVYLSCGNQLYRSTDKGQTWTSITGNLPAINIRRVLSDDYSTNERLFVSLGTFVYYKNNTTTTWTNHSNNMGLPSVASVSDFMIYNDSTAGSILRLSTYGRGVWECNINNNLLPSVDFVSNKQFICPGDTVRYSKTVYGLVNSFTWNFPGGLPATSTLDSPIVVYNALGSYNASLAATGPSGTATNTKSNYIVVSNGSGNNIVEGFEGAAFPPLAWQSIVNSGTPWIQTNTAGGFGLSPHSTLYDNYNHDANGSHDIMLTPKADLAGITNAQISFDVAYARWSGGYPDSLMLQVSTDCGHTFTPVYVKSGTQLATAPDNTTALFVPTATQWRKDTVSLNAFLGNGVIVSFENIGHYGQGIYVDNVNLQMAPLSQFAGTDTNVCIGNSVQFNDQSNNATSWAWTFPGGTPASSTLQNPVVTYSSLGNYSVTLVTTNALGNNTNVKTNYIHVLPLPTVSITAAGNVLTATAGGSAYQWYLGGNPIPGATNATYTAAQSGAYTVRITGVNGCINTSSVYNHFMTGINSINKQTGIEIYPNPTNGKITIEANGLTGNDLIITCYNAAGVAVLKHPARQNNGVLKTVADLSALPRGVYEIRLQTSAGQKFTKTIVLQ